MKSLSAILLGFITFYLTTFSQATEMDKEIDKKIGQMLMVGFRGLEVNDSATIKRDIVEYHIGAVILFDYDVSSKTPSRNIESVEQVKQLTRDLQSLASTRLIIGIDEEGGQVSRLTKKLGLPATPSPQKLGEMNEVAQTYHYASTIAKRLNALGINMNLAPVVDVNVNPSNPVIGKKERSFSTEAKPVARHAQSFIKAHRDNHVLTTLKHFPGHGSSESDSHEGFVDVSKNWSSIELIPYQHLIDNGFADAIMTAHVFNEKLDARYPATLSKATLTDVLRAQLNWRGVILSDDLMMEAIVGQYDLKTAIRKAIEAGVDILLFGNNTKDFDPDIVIKATRAIHELLEAGVITEGRIDASYQRVMELKRRLELE